MNTWKNSSAAARTCWLKMVCSFFRSIILSSNYLLFSMALICHDFDGRPLFPAVKLQFTSIPDERYDEHRRSSGFMKEYIFPGGLLPSLSRVTSAMAASSRLW